MDLDRLLSSAPPWPERIVCLTEETTEILYTIGAGAETTAQMFVPQGFSVDVIAAEPQLHQPMAFTFDTRGRLWVEICTRVSRRAAGRDRARQGQRGNSGSHDHRF